MNTTLRPEKTISYQQIDNLNGNAGTKVEVFENNFSYQIVINAYLREVENTWCYFNKTPKKIKNLPDNWSYNDPIIHIKLPQQQHEILISLRYYSHTLRHQFNFPIISRSSNQSRWSALNLSHFISLTMREIGQHKLLGSGELDTLIFRCLSSQKNTETFIKHRYKDFSALNDGRPLSFIDSEQSLVIGHQLHPIAKSREGFSSTELLRYSPETTGHFQLHYFAIDSRYVHQDSALAEDSVSLVKRLLTEQLVKQDNLGSLGSLKGYLNNSNCALIPVHPWQASHLRNQAQVQNLESSGLLTYLGPLGEAFTATTSIRTVFNKHCPFMFKFSLNMRITNSERVNKSWELDRVVESARMMQLPIATDIKASTPSFTIVDEPAYLTIKIDGQVLDGFSCILRDAKDFIDPERDITAITGLVQDNPLGGHGRLHQIIEKISVSEQCPINEAAINWFDRYLNVAIKPLMMLFIDWGLCFEPHGQNTLLELKNGYPIHCFCRDGQGFFHRQAAHADWCKIMPNKGEKSESIFPEELAKERLIYYPFINQVFSVINAFGTQLLADEKVLMDRLRQCLREINEQPQRYEFSLFDVLENSQRLPCKGNLLTQLYDMDELVGDIASQSIYVSVPNSYKDTGL